MSGTDDGRISPRELADFCAAAVREKLAEHVLLLPVAEQTSIADYFVICTATSEPHLQALYGFVERQVRDRFRVRVHSRCGSANDGWMVLDFCSVVVHLMTEAARTRYDLEGIWSDTPDRDAVARLESRGAC